MGRPIELPPDPGEADETVIERRSKMIEQRLALQAGLADWATNGRHRVHAGTLNPVERFAFVEKAAVEHFGRVQVDGFIRSQTAQISRWPLPRPGR